MCDFDGYASGSIIYQFIKMISPNQPIEFFIHESKGHGIVQNKEEDLVQEVINHDIQLLICPDAASNDVKQMAELRSHNICAMALDHHEVNTVFHYGIIVNHHIGKGLNTALSGAGVTMKFCQAYSEEYGIELGDLFYDLVASSLATDSCSMLTKENYALTKYGFTHLNNPMLIRMFEEFNTRGATPEGVSWGMGSRVNAVIRSGTMEEKRKVFEAFVSESNVEEAINIAKNCHKVGSETATKIARQVKKEMDFDHKVLVGFCETKDKNYSGLVASKLNGEYNKPTLILRSVGNRWTGSLRSPVEIADKINESGFAFCQGHKSACGITALKDNLSKLIEWFDNSNLDMKPPVPVTAKLKTVDLNLNLCRACEDNKLIWGKDISKPNFYVELTTTPDSVIIYKKPRASTVKLKFGKGYIMKFRAKASDCDMLETEKCKIQAIVTLSPNEYNGFITPQAIVEEWEITPIKYNEEEDWRDFF